MSSTMTQTVLTVCVLFLLTPNGMLNNRVDATLVVVSVEMNDTVFSVEEYSIDSTSAFGLEVIAFRFSNICYTTELLCLLTIIIVTFLQGYLQVADPLDACSPLLNSVTFNNSINNESNKMVEDSEEGEDSTKMILLAISHQNTTCSLSQKAKYAQVAGFEGIIILKEGTTVNDTLAFFPSFMAFDWIGVHIFACLVSEDVGNILMEKYAGSVK